MGIGPHGTSLLERTGKKSILDMTMDEGLMMVMLDQGERTEKRQRARVRFFGSKPRVVKAEAKVEYECTRGKVHYWKWEDGVVMDTEAIRGMKLKIPKLPKPKDRRIVE